MYVRMIAPGFIVFSQLDDCRPTSVTLPFELLPCVEPSIAKLHPQF